MLEYLKELLKELKIANKDICPIITPKNIKQKTIALDSAITILETIKYKERNDKNEYIKFKNYFGKNYCLR